MFPENYSRIDYNAPMYIDIAMDAFYKANNLYLDLMERDFPNWAIEEMKEFTKNTTISVVFSAMTIESFLNNYAATCLGDSEFYGDFDKLSAIGKLQLISKFILKSPIKKSEACYYRTKKLFHDRDAYVHNKSRDLSWKDIENIQKKLDTPKKLIEKATNAIKTIRDIALYFDSIDPNVNAVDFLINPKEVLIDPKENTEVKRYILNVLEIKIPQITID